MCVCVYVCERERESKRMDDSGPPFDHPVAQYGDLSSGANL